jgi:hypothetical protein
MLLMQELDFPDGKNPEFCARSFFNINNSWAGWLSVPKQFLPMAECSLNIFC